MIPTKVQNCFQAEKVKLSFMYLGTGRFHCTCQLNDFVRLLWVTDERRIRSVFECVLDIFSVHLLQSLKKKKEKVNLLYISAVAFLTVDVNHKRNKTGRKLEIYFTFLQHFFFSVFMQVWGESRFFWSSRNFLSGAPKVQNAKQ